MIGLSDDRMAGLSDCSASAFPAPQRETSGLVRSYRDLEVYRMAFAASIRIHKASLDFPKMEQYALAGQIRRSTKGICANIAEGFAKQQGSSADFRRFLLMALGSAHETMVWIEYCKELGYIDAGTFSDWKTAYESITRMLQSFISRM